MTPDDPSPARGPFLPLALGLVALVLAAFHAVGALEFVNYDDPLYVTENPMVRRGLTAESVQWAFTTYHTANWIPLTWLSHMLDATLWGQDPAGHHGTSALLHLANALLVFAFLRSATGRPWPSFFVAALFAVHPLRVESVAWVSERKDVLAAFFVLLSLLAWVRYARGSSPLAWVAALVALALGLLAKPMGVTLPFVFLLLDLWPLGRRRGPHAVSWSRLVLEKLPFLALVVGSSVITVVAQHTGGAVGTVASLPLLDRVANAGLAVLGYLERTFVPLDLAVFYPHPAIVGWGSLGRGGALALGALTVLLPTAFFVWRRRSSPGGLVGWLWFLGMLVPVIGLVQVGDQALADRYSYLPSIGLFVALVWSFAGWVETRTELRPHLAGAGGLALLVLVGLTVRQVGFWKDSRTLFEHARETTEDNYVALNNLGLLDLEAGRFEPALALFRRAVELDGRYYPAWYNLGLALEALGRFPEAMTHYDRMLARFDGESTALVRQAEIQRLAGDRTAARALYERAVSVNPDDAAAWTFLARLLLKDGEIDRAANCAASALKLAPERPEPWLMMGEVGIKRADFENVEGYLLKALELGPDLPQVHAKLGAWYLRKRDNGAAEAELAKALELDRTLPEAHMTLGMLRFGEGRIDDARGHFQAVLDENPTDVEAHNAVGAILLEEARTSVDEGERRALLEQARGHFETALGLRPDFARARTNLALYHELRGEWAKVIETYAPLLALEPADVEAARASAWIWATGPDPALLDGEKAFRWAEYAAKRQDLRAIEVLAAACARKGDFKQAVEWQKRAIEIERGPRKAELEARLQAYEQGQPYTRTR